jgi:hypothetical protein
MDKMESTIKWKQIKDTPYIVSEYGHIIRTEVGANNRGRKPLSHRLLRTGYHRVLLCYNGFQIDKYVHRLVAEAFVENPRSFTEVNHKDGNKGNNHYTNLEWLSHSMNHQHAAMNNLTNPRRLLNEDDVRVIKWALKNRPDLSHQNLADLYEVTKGTIGDINTGRSWRYVTI